MIRSKLYAAVAAVLAVSPLAVAAKPVGSSPPLERQVALEGVHNFRDVGGYRTTDGHTVKYGKLYRSGTMGGLTAADQRALEARGIRAIVDLRSAAERQADKSAWLTAPGHSYWASTHAEGSGDLARFFGGGPITAAGARQMMASAYRLIVAQQIPAYRELFRQLETSRGAVIVNCTAGKDRTGVAAALVLTALRVPRATVYADYMLSNGAVPAAVLGKAMPPGVVPMSSEVASILLGVAPDYLDAAFDQMRKDYGSVDAYLSRALGVGPRERAALRRRMLD